MQQGWITATVRLASVRARPPCHGLPLSLLILYGCTLCSIHFVHTSTSQINLIKSGHDLLHSCLHLVFPETAVPTLRRQGVNFLSSETFATCIVIACRFPLNFLGHFAPAKSFVLYSFGPSNTFVVSSDGLGVALYSQATKQQAMRNPHFVTRVASLVFVHFASGKRAQNALC